MDAWSYEGGYFNNITVSNNIYLHIGIYVQLYTNSIDKYVNNFKTRFRNMKETAKTIRMYRHSVLITNSIRG